MIKKTLLALVTLLMIASCGQQFTSLPTVTIEPTTTKSIATLTPIPSQTPEPAFTATPTEWIKIYPTKNILVIYGGVARTQYSELFYNRGYFDFSPFLVLYTDGQLIISGSYTKKLSQKETEGVLAKLDQLKFFRIQESQDHIAANDPKNPLYTQPAGSVQSDSFINLREVYVNNRHGLKKIIYEKRLEKYLIRPMKDIISYLESFSAKDATPYQPDRLLVGFITEKESPIPKDATVIPWPGDVTSPSQSSRYDGVLYLEGAEALKLYNIVEENPYAYFIYEGITFEVNLRPIYPHECHTYRFYPDLRQPFFTCDDW